MSRCFAGRAVFWTLSAIILIATLNGCQGVARGYNNPSLTGSIRPEVLKLLKDGRLLDARKALEERYRPQRCGGPGRAGGDLSTQELSVLCDIYARHVAIEEARACLATLECRGVSARKLKEKTAWLDYLTGNFIAAEANSRRASTQGGRYIHALARAQLDEEGRNYARDQAARWVKADDPGTVFQGAQLFAVLGDYAAVHDALQDPFRRLAQDYSENYGEAQTKDLFGRPVASAPLRSDPFHLMRYGVLNRFSFAPRENIYVETLLAESEVELARYSEAATRLERLLADPRLPAYVDAHWRALFRRGQVYEQWESDFAAAEDHYREAIEVIERTRSLLTTESQRSSFFGNREGPYQAMAALKLRQGDIAGAFAYTERHRSRALVELLATVDQFGAQGVSARDIEALLDDYAEYEIGLAEARYAPDPGIVGERLRSLTRKGRRDVRLWPPQVRSVVSPDAPDLDGIQTALGTNEVLLSFVRLPEWRVFIVHEHGYDSAPLSLVRLQGEDLGSAVERFREDLEQGKAAAPGECVGNGDALGCKLYDVLLGPVAERGYLGGSPRLTIVPYGALHHLPFAALRAPDGSYLVQRHALALLPSATVRTYFEPPGRSHKVLALGNPKLVGVDLPSLPYAEAEAAEAAKYDPGSPPLVGEDATDYALFAMAPGKEVIHIASHGIFDSANPLGSGVKLAPDVDITMERLFKVPSNWNTRLTVLSGCETGLNRINPGQEIVGLQRGFLYAGTTGLVSTLWAISDEPTYLLMKDFYRFYFTGNKPAADALREAQREAIRAGRPPQTWAAFTYMGLQR